MTNLREVGFFYFHRLNDMSNELELLLSNLSAINDSMSHLGSEQNGQSASIHHTLQRHREILLDYKQVSVLTPKILNCLQIMK